MNREIVAGIVGCGNIARFHCAGLEKAGARVAMVCDLVADKTKEFAGRFAAKPTDDWRRVVDNPDINLVVVTTISSLHKEICLAAIAAGKAVVCEKTLTENAEDSLEVVKAATTAATPFYTSYMKRFIPAVIKARELMPSLGRIVSAQVRTHQPWGALWQENPADGFFHTPADGHSLLRKTTGGGILVCGGSHMLDLILFLFGRPQWLCADFHVPPGRDYDLRASAIMGSDNTIVHFEALAHPLERIGFQADGWDERIEINGTGGRLEILSAKWDEPEKASMLVHTGNGSEAATDYRFDPVSPFEKAQEFFCANIAEWRQGEQSCLTGYEVDELISHIMRSSETRERIDIKWRV